jgi:ferritin-like metal-binding protein YciE
MPATQADTKVSQYLNEAQATEQALIQTLRAHIAMTPAGSYREALEEHLTETREHSRLVQDRLGSIASGVNLARVAVWTAELGIGLAETVTGRMLAIWKAPIDLMRGRSGEEKLLKNAKDECASEALEIATYEALQRVAEAVGDEETAELARRIRADEERMLARLRQEITKLADAVVGAEVEGRPTYRIDRTGAADAARRAVRTTRRAGRRTAGAAADRVAKAGQETAGTVDAAGRETAAATDAAAAPVQGAGEQTARVAGAAGREAAGVTDAAAAQVEEAGEQAARTARTPRRRSQTESRSRSGGRETNGRSSGSSSRSPRASASRSRRAADQEPWPGYNQQTVPEVRDALNDANQQTVSRVLEYEREHKDRTAVEQAAERQLDEKG